MAEAHKTRLLVKYHFGLYSPGDRITDADEIKAILAEHPDYVLQERLVAASEPTKAEVKAAGVPPETQARVDAGLPARPLKVAEPDADEKAKKK